MNQLEKNTQGTQKKSPIPYPDKDGGFFNSSTVLLSPENVFQFCQDSQNIEKALTDLPMEVNNFLDLKLISAEKINNDQFEIKWQNKPESKIAGTLSFILQKAPANHGTILLAEAIFEQFESDEEEPSNLMKIFVKRMKALMETGVLATTKGQPSGREELSTTEEKTLH